MTSTTVFFVFIPLLAFILLAVNLIFAPHYPYQEKDSAFECGFHSFLGQNRTQFSISFFIFALLFLLFDLEILLVYPYIVSAYSNSIYGLSIVVIFIVVLTFGLFFELGKNALKINSRQMYNIYNKQPVIYDFLSSSMTKASNETHYIMTANLLVLKKKTISLFLRHAAFVLIFIFSLPYLMFMWLVGVKFKEEFKPALDYCVYNVLHLNPNDLSFSYFSNIFIKIPSETGSILNSFLNDNYYYRPGVIVAITYIVLVILMWNLLLARKKDKGFFSSIFSIIKAVYTFITGKDSSVIDKIFFIWNTIREVYLVIVNYLKNNFKCLFWVMMISCLITFGARVLLFINLDIDDSLLLRLFMFVCIFLIGTFSFVFTNALVLEGKLDNKKELFIKSLKLITIGRFFFSFCIYILYIQYILPDVAIPICAYIWVSYIYPYIPNILNFRINIGPLKPLNLILKGIRCSIETKNYGFVFNKVPRLPIVNEYLIKMRYSKIKYSAFSEVKLFNYKNNSTIIALTNYSFYMRSKGRIIYSNTSYLENKVIRLYENACNKNLNYYNYKKSLGFNKSNFYLPLKPYKVEGNNLFIWINTKVSIIEGINVIDDSCNNGESLLTGKKTPEIIVFNYNISLDDIKNLCDDLERYIIDKKNTEDKKLASYVSDKDIMDMFNNPGKHLMDISVNMDIGTQGNTNINPNTMEGNAIYSVPNPAIIHYGYPVSQPELRKLPTKWALDKDPVDTIHTYLYELENNLIITSNKWLRKSGSVQHLHPENKTHYLNVIKVLINNKFRDGETELSPEWSITKQIAKGKPRSDAYIQYVSRIDNKKAIYSLQDIQQNVYRLQNTMSLTNTEITSSIPSGYSNLNTSQAKPFNSTAGSSTVNPSHLNPVGNIAGHPSTGMSTIESFDVNTQIDESNISGIESSVQRGKKAIDHGEYSYNPNHTFDSSTIESFDVNTQIDESNIPGIESCVQRGKKAIDHGEYSYNPNHTLDSLVNDVTKIIEEKLENFSFKSTEVPSNLINGKDNDVYRSMTTYQKARLISYISSTTERVNAYNKSKIDAFSHQTNDLYYQIDVTFGGVILNDRIPVNTLLINKSEQVDSFDTDCGSMLEANEIQAVDRMYGIKKTEFSETRSFVDFVACYHAHQKLELVQLENALNEFIGVRTILKKNPNGLYINNSKGIVVDPNALEQIEFLVKKYGEDQLKSDLYMHRSPSKVVINSLYNHHSALIWYKAIMSCQHTRCVNGFRALNVFGFRNGVNFYINHEPPRFEIAKIHTALDGERLDWW